MKNECDKAVTLILRSCKRFSRIYV